MSRNENSRQWNLKVKGGIQHLINTTEVRIGKLEGRSEKIIKMHHREIKIRNIKRPQISIYLGTEMHIFK